MKWISFLLIFAFGVHAQWGYPDYKRDGILVEPRNKIIGAKADGVDTTRSFYLGEIKGTLNCFFITDTSVATTASGGVSDSCMTINIQLKHDAPNAIWSNYGLKGFGVTYTRLDTISRDIVNTASTNGGFYYPLLFDSDAEIAPFDSARFILQIGVGDSLYLTDLRILGY